jgi:signal transduction histidine kinase
MNSRTGPAAIAEIEVPPNPIEARLQLAAIVDSSDDAIISKDLTGIITSWNAAATRVFGYLPHEIVGKSVLTLIPSHLQSRRLRKDGQLIHISLTISPIRDTDGRIVGISKIARDITERKIAEAALFESERMAAIGRMAASIAHEVNNPLEAILNLSYLLDNHPSLDAEARSFARMLVNEVIRVSEITRQTLSFYRDNSRMGNVDIATIVEGVLDLHRPLTEQKKVRLTTRFKKSPPVWGSPGELRQVFTNLVVNALDALPRGGRIAVSVTPASAGRGVCVTIADNGPGIPESVRNRIFEPFFTTKTSTGTGLGLWISQGIVRKYGGSIRMRTATAPRSWTVFRVCLPSGAEAGA